MSKPAFSHMRCLKCRLEEMGKEPPPALVCSCAPYRNWEATQGRERKPDPDGRLRRSPSKHRRREVLARDKMTCRYCGLALTINPGPCFATIDHVVPWSRGGGRRKENLVACCDDCNQKKRDRTPEEAGMPLLPIPES